MSRLLMVLGLYLTLGLTLSACSNQQVYNGLQAMESSRCVEGPANEFEQCLQRQSMGYDEYATLREAGDEPKR